VIVNVSEVFLYPEDMEDIAHTHSDHGTIIGRVAKDSELVLIREASWNVFFDLASGEVFKSPPMATLEGKFRPSHLRFVLKSHGEGRSLFVRQVGHVTHGL
jgi:hypothetical protein